VIEGTPQRDVVVVPSEAIIRSGRRNVVIVSRGEGRFAPREVTLGLSSGEGSTEVTSGLEAGDDVVVSSQFLIDSESRLQEVIDKLLGPAEREEDAAPAPAGAPAADPSNPEAPMDPDADPHAHHHGMGG
jgi:hypothetical protein